MKNVNHFTNVQINTNNTNHVKFITILQNSWAVQNKHEIISIHVLKNYEWLIPVIE